MKTDTAGRVWTAAPFHSSPMTTGSIQGLWLLPGEKVNWHWSHNTDGTSYVSGYTIENKITFPHEFKKDGG